MKTKIILEVDAELTQEVAAAAAHQAMKVLRKRGIKTISATTDDAECGHHDIVGEDGVPVAAIGDIDPPQVAVVLEGGVVQSIVSDRPDEVNADVVIIDYDTDGMEDEYKSYVRQDSGTYAEANVYSLGVGKAAIGLDDIVDEQPVE